MQEHSLSFSKIGYFCHFIEFIANLCSSEDCLCINVIPIDKADKLAKVILENIVFFFLSSLKKIEVLL